MIAVQRKTVPVPTEIGVLEQIKEMCDDNTLPIVVLAPADPDDENNLGIQVFRRDQRGNWNIPGDSIAVSEGFIDELPGAVVITAAIARSIINGDLHMSGDC